MWWYYQPLDGNDLQFHWRATGSVEPKGYVPPAPGEILFGLGYYGSPPGNRIRFNFREDGYTSPGYLVFAIGRDEYIPPRCPPSSSLHFNFTIPRYTPPQPPLESPYMVLGFEEAPLGFVPVWLLLSLINELDEAKRRQWNLLNELDKTFGTSWNLRNALGEQIQRQLVNSLGLQRPFSFLGKIEGLYPIEIRSSIAEVLFISVVNDLVSLGANTWNIVNNLGFDPKIKPTEFINRILSGEINLLVDIVNSIVQDVMDEAELVNYIGSKLMKQLELINSILETNPEQVEFVLKNMIGNPAFLHWGDFKLKADQGPWVATGDWDIKLDGESIKEYVSAVSINLNEDHFTNSFEATIDCVELWDRLEPDGSQDLRITIKIGIDLFKFLLETRKLSGSVSERSINIWGRGKTAVLDSPYMLKLEDEYASEGMASDVIQSLASGFTIDFRIPDYFIPGETLELAGRSRIEVISEIARAGGGIVRCGPQGELIIRPKHPYDPDTMNLESPVWEYSDFDDVIQLDEEWLQESGYNAILVESEVPSNAGANVSGTIVLDEELSPSPLREGDPVYVRVYLVAIPDFSDPNYPGSFYELRVTDGSTVYRGTIVKEETEVVQVTANQGSTRYPILELVSYDWIGLDAGDLQVDPERENKLVLIPSGSRTEGLVRVTYRTAYDSWQLIGANENTILFVAAKEI